jgi:hypothetical protein
VSGRCYRHMDTLTLGVRSAKRTKIVDYGQSDDLMGDESKCFIAGDFK